MSADLTPLPLFMESAPHSGGKASRDAAADIRPHLMTLRQRVLLFVAGRAAGATRDEIADGLKMNANTVRPRVVELIENGNLRESGEFRRTASGRKAAVLVRV